MTEAEAAEYLRCSVKTLQRRRRDEQISFIRDGGIRYQLSDLKDYLAARRTAATKAPPPLPAPKYRASRAQQQDIVEFLYGCAPAFPPKIHEISEA
ncbi:helix-turn-helix domain-containing protein [Limimaricola sp. G21655-S1]|uniref:helix-turn-helix domain-containing protein n=1 Tax=Limimaricola sp. G21655-S1 TaxID=3014768 RepID=UPI0022B00369|nr:helix-turn-helix domain-containing protein [Limimaricola sp. G21655-S1]MCZ4262872.1 helix-turn-helix domain-containing protein [Limimaricola sp. G21655-S1]